MNYENEIVNDLPKGIFCWYNFKSSSKILHITSQENAITSYLRQQKLDVTCVAVEELLTGFQGAEEYDYILAVSVLESCQKPKQLLHACKNLLAKDGKLLLATDNRLGIRYFCGDRDPYTERNFDGIENYRRVSAVDKEKMEGRIMDKATVEVALQEAGFVSWQSFSVFPNIDAAQLLYAQDYLPEEDLSMRYFPMYNHPDTVFLEEQYLYESLIKNNMFHQMANGYLFECSLGEHLEEVKHVTLSMDRGEQSAMATVIGRDGCVRKKAIYAEGVQSLKQLQENHADLKNHGISVVDGTIENDTYVMPYVEAELAMLYLQELLRRDKEAFIQEIDRFRDLILKSSEHVAPTPTEYEKREILKDAPIEKGVWLAKGYFDLVPLNAFYQNGEYVFFDQEFYIENYPVNAILVRVVDIVYGGHAELETILPRTFFWERYGIENQVQYLRQMSGEFLYKLRHQKELRLYNEAHKGNVETIHSNRQKMNYSAGEYQRLFVDIFRNVEGRKLILFGSGNFAKKFLALYGQDYPVYAIIDNNADKWGQELEGVSISSPDILSEMDPREYKVLICIKNYTPVMKQLKEMGVAEYSVYDTNMDYPRKKRVMEVAAEVTQDVPKKYHIGYIAGVFDLFHVGHLNMFKRAKEQCEYLIVGVVTDEGVRKNKKVEPFIPFEERIEMVRSCRYVDEAVEIPFQYAGTRDAYRMHHFDVQFSGSDYVNDPNWLAEKAFLEKQGVDMVFFPYTEGTSSTKIKAMIEKSLL